MILAINLNAAVDQILFIDRFVPGAHMRTTKTKMCIGGKGLDTALVLKTLGADHRAITLVAGKNGEILVELLAQHGVVTEPIWVPGETRLAHVVVEMYSMRHSHITTSGYGVTRDHLEDYLEKVASLAPSADWAAIAGTLPPGASVDFYREIVELLHSYRVKVLVDCFGDPMLEVLKSPPEIVKMNQQEVWETLGVHAEDLEGWQTLGEAVRRDYRLNNLVITCGKEGILAFTPEGIIQASGPALAEVNAAGAGDAASAAIVFRLSEGDSWQGALSWAIAAGAAVVVTEGTAECYLKDILQFLPNVQVRSLRYRGL